MSRSTPKSVVAWDDSVADARDRGGAAYTNIQQIPSPAQRLCRVICSANEKCVQVKQQVGQIFYAITRAGLHACRENKIRIFEAISAITWLQIDFLMYLDFLLNSLRTVSGYQDKFKGQDNNK